MTAPKEFSFKNVNKDDFIHMIDNKNNTTKKGSKKIGGRSSQDGMKKYNTKI